jgi:hypothetical protein
MSELRKRGLTATVICSEPFIKLGTTQAKVLGTADLPLVKIPHPLGGLSLEQVEGRALVAVPQIVKLIQEHAK